MFQTLSASPFPSIGLRTSSEKYISVAIPAGPTVGGGKNRFELRADADEVGSSEMVRIKCQREFVLKAKMAKDGDAAKIKRRMEGGPAIGSVDDEISRKWAAPQWLLVGRA